MKVTGFRLRESIQFQRLQLNNALAQFDSSLYAFEGDQKAAPEKLDEIIVEAERAIAQLQTAQAYYNLRVMVEVGMGGEMITLCEAVKRIGGAGRREKMWRSGSARKKDRFG
jgi:hypothetical protein